MELNLFYDGIMGCAIACLELEKNDFKIAYVIKELQKCINDMIKKETQNG